VTVTPEAMWVNGRAAGEVSVLDRGLHYGDGLFETIGCLQGSPRLFDLHLQRLGEGCGRLGFAPHHIEAVSREVPALAAGAGRAIVKVLLTRGAAPARGYALTGEEQAMRILLRYPWPQPDPAAAREGVRVRVAAVRLGENPALAGLKHCNRLEQVLARREWSDPLIAEALMFSSSGALISGTMSNVFLVQNSTLLTPSLERCGVAGVMRQTVLALARGAGIDAQVRRIAAEDLERAQELFLTNALTGIRPVCELSGRRAAVGALTRRLQGLLTPLLAPGATPRGDAHD
jgi:4-amino-4-deoxychorismate lyase